MLSVDHIASCKRQDFSGTPGAGLDHKLSNASYRASSPHSSALNRLQAITPVSASSIRQAPVERLQLMPASALSQHLAKLGETALTPNQKILHDAGYQRVTIGGQDNRCWIRAPWFAILNHHMQSGTFSNLKSSIIQTLQSSDNSSVQHWFQQNQATVEEAFAALESPAHTSNFTLNKQGYFCPAVEALIENVSKATFSGNPNSNVEPMLVILGALIPLLYLGIRKVGSAE